MPFLTFPTKRTPSWSILISPRNSNCSNRPSANGARSEVAPHIHELDRQHRFDPAILPQMAELGLLGCSVPVEFGGAGMDYVSLGIISEELEYVDTSLRVIMSVHAGLNCLTLLTWGSDDQKQRYLFRRPRAGRSRPMGSPNRQPAATSAASRPSPSSAGIATSSPAKRCGSRSPTSPTTSSSSPGPTSRRRNSATPRASARSSWSAASRGSRAAR